MLIYGGARLAPRYFLRHESRRLYTLQNISDGFLDLAIALPLPPSFPSYSTTIILVTVFSRLLFTVPVSVWAKKREWRIQDTVMPHLEKLKPALSQSVLRDMQRENVVGTKQEIQALHTKRMKTLLAARRDQLFDEHNCRPLPTILVPTLTQLPIFVLTSAVLARLSQSPTPFDSESFLTLTTLAHADPTMAMPIVLGIVTMANVESSRWLMTDEQKAREAKVNKWNAEKRAAGHTVLEPKKYVQSSLRLLSVGRILLGGLMPGGVVLYWATSATFGLLQTWLFDWWETRRKQSRTVSNFSHLGGMKIKVV